MPAAHEVRTVHIIFQKLIEEASAIEFNTKSKRLEYDFACAIYNLGAALVRFDSINDSIDPVQLSVRIKNEITNVRGSSYVFRKPQVLL